MSFLVYIAVYAFGILTTLLLLAGALVFLIKTKPNYLHDRLTGLTRALFPPEMRMHLVPNIPIPAHILEGRILENGTPVLVNRDGSGQYVHAEVITTKVSPKQGNYYHVSSKLFSGTGTRWVPASYVWELPNVMGNLEAAA